MKKHLLIPIMLLLFNTIIFAQIPNEISYQGLITDENGDAINGNVTITFALYESETGGTPVWTEVKNDVEITNGYLNIYLGDLSALQDLDFNKTYWLEVKIDDSSPFPRTKLSAVPYSFYTLRADYSETAGLALTVPDSSITQEKLAPEVRAIPWGDAGGSLDGEYPNPSISSQSIIDAIEPGSITQDKLAANITALPIGEARGDLVGFYPEPSIRPGVIKTEYFALECVTAEVLGPESVETSKIHENAVTLDKMAHPQELGQIIFWDSVAQAWQYSGGIEPIPPIDAQVMVWNADSNYIEWDVDGLYIPWSYIGETVDDATMFSIKKTDLTGGIFEAIYFPSGTITPVGNAITAMAFEGNALKASNESASFSTIEATNTRGAALKAMSNPVLDGYVAEVINTAPMDGRVMYIEGHTLNLDGVDPVPRNYDKEAILIVNNTMDGLALLTYGDAYMNGSLGISGTFTAATLVADELYVNNYGWFGSNVDIVGNIDLTGNYTSPSGSITLTDGSIKLVNGDFTIGGALNVTGLTTTGDISCGGDFSVAGTSTLNGPTSVNNTFDVIGNTTITGTLGVSDATLLGNTLGVTGITTLASNLGVGGNATVTGTLGVTDVTTLASDLNVGGNATVTGTSTLNGPTTINNTLDVTSNTTLGGTLILPIGVAINEFSTDGTLADNSDNAVPTEQAVKTYVDDHNAFLTTANVTSNSPGTLATDDFVFGSPQLDDDGDVNHDYRFFFDKSKGAFRAGYVDGTQWDDINRGNNSVAWGGNTTASGAFSTAWGYNTTASGGLSTAWGQNTISANNSTAWGEGSTASGERSTAWGYNTTASGFFSTVWGAFTTAKSYAQTTLGSWNTDVTGNLTSWVPTDRLFVIGNGTWLGSESDALVMLKNGNTTLNGELSVSSSFTLPNGTTINEFSTDGTLADNSDVAVPTEQAVKTYVDANNAFLTTANVTSNSPGTLATDDFVFGSSQLDDDGDVNHDYRFFFDKSKGAFRTGNVDGTQWDNVNRGVASMAWGDNTTASNTNSTAWGWISIASGQLSTAWGGNTTASGVFSTAWGSYTNAKSYAQTTFGHFSTDVSGNLTAPVLTDRLFVIGNGSGPGFRSDALVMLKNGNTTLNGNFDVNGNLTVSSSFTLPNGTTINEFSTDGTLAGNSDNAVPTEQAVKTYVDANAAGASAIDDLSDGATDATSVFLGTDAGANDDGSNNNTAVGITAMNANTSGTNNTAIGYGALYTNTSGKDNTAMGYGALSNIDGSNYNTAVGYYSLANSTTGSYNTGVGNEALRHANGAGNTAVGYKASGEVTTGTLNTSLGQLALRNTTSGSSNVAIGANALIKNTTGGSNVAIGYYAGSSNVSGGISVSNNVVIGSGAGFKFATGANNNILIGYQAADNLQSGANNIIIGYDIDASSATASNELNIGNLITGDMSTGTVSFNSAYTFPATDGSAGQVLATNGAGEVSWADDGGGAFSTITNVTSNSGGSLGSDDFVFGSSQLADDGNTAHDARFFFHKGKGAFRAGAANSTQWDNTNIGLYSFASGGNTTAQGNRSTAMGDNTSAGGNRSTAMGCITSAAGDYSTAMGEQTTAESYAQTNIGRFSTNLSGTAGSWVTTDRLFVIGNGTGVGSESDALVMLKNGNTTLDGEFTITKRIVKSNTTNGSINLSSLSAYSIIKVIAGTGTMTMPSAPADGQEITVVNASTGTIDYGGKTIAIGEAGKFVYVGGWYPIN